jgi:prepilin-type N-terminal cleavage/methylation domain-containing protein
MNLPPDNLILPPVASAILADVEPRLPARRNRVAAGKTTFKSSVSLCGPFFRAVPHAGPPSTAGKDACCYLAPRPASCRAFTLIEVLVVVTLLSVVVLALMDVFNSTQRAFRAAVTQTDVLEGSRAAMDLMISDLRAMTPSQAAYYNAVNFCSTNNSYAYAPLTQILPGSSTQRTNLLNYFFILGRQNTKWTGTGYIVDTTSANPLYPLYRFYAETNITQQPIALYYNFINEINQAQWTNMSHLLDGVVHLVVRPCDLNGVWMTNAYTAPVKLPSAATFLYPNYGESVFYFYSNAIPASVEVQMAVVEDRALQRAQSLSASYSAMTNYLANQSGAVHVFRQTVTIPNVDRSAYQ